MSRKTIQLVIPAYNESDCVDELADRLIALFDSEPEYDFEAIIIENGSTDDTMEKLLKARERDARLTIVQLARNFRMDGGITAGLSVATADAVVLMTADLQDPPELIPTFIRKWEEGYENIYGVVTKRTGTGPLRTFNSKAFYWLAGKLTDGLVTKNASDFRLIDRGVYEAVRSMNERNRFVRGLVSWVGFKSIGVDMVREPRFAGESKAYSFKVIDLAFKGIFAHSYVPLRMISVFGAAVAVVSVVALAVLAVQALFFGVPFDGFGTLMSVMLIAFGSLMFMMGIIGEYVGLVYEEVKQRPNFIIARTIGL